jgi:hypothetical protein
VIVKNWKLLSAILAALSLGGCATTARNGAQAGAPSDPGQGARDAYNAACFQSLAGDKDAAFTSLRRALALGFRNLSHLQEDSDLTLLHGDPRWAEIVAQAQANQDAYLRSVNAELVQLFQEDQRDRAGGDPRKLNWAEVNVGYPAPLAPLFPACEMLSLLRLGSNTHRGDVAEVREHSRQDGELPQC